jgi:hypothetical protein
MKIQQYLRDNGYPEHVVREGKPGMVRKWREFVERAERGYSLGLEDYRNDLDARGILRLSDADEMRRNYRGARRPLEETAHRKKARVGKRPLEIPSGTSAIRATPVETC